MQSKDIPKLLDQIGNCLTDDLSQARYALGNAFVSILKAVYVQFRGQASPASMHMLLESEVAVGGEDADFKQFDSQQMVDLFARGALDDRLLGDASLSITAVDLCAIVQWLNKADDQSTTPAMVRFVHAWLRLFAEEAGLIDVDDPMNVTSAIQSDATETAIEHFPGEGKPYSDPITGIEFVLVPGGIFSMGDTFDEGVEDEKPVHEITLSPFYMATCPVTQAQWQRLMPENPSNCIGDDHPVEQVTLADVAAFLDKLNDALPGDLLVDLPSEAQWEYAARSGGKDQLYAGGQDPDTVAWFEDNSTGGTAPVGGKSPNGLGLYDMSGNVWEWCRDIYHPEAYQRHEKIDPVCSHGGTDRVIRGGSWHLDAWSARCSRRFRFDPDLYGPGLGFRLVMGIGNQ